MFAELSTKVENEKTPLLRSRHLDSACVCGGLAEVHPQAKQKIETCRWSRPNGIAAILEKVAMRGCAQQKCQNMI